MTHSVLYKTQPLFRFVRSVKHKFEHCCYDTRLLENVNHKKDKLEKRALLVYLTRPFLKDQHSKKFVAHTNSWRSLEIARLLDELGFIVDVINWDNYQTSVGSNYDLMLGFGRAEKLASEHPTWPNKIFLSTGTVGVLTNQYEKERIEYIRINRGCNLKPVRFCNDNPSYLKYFDAIACLGNEVTAETYRPYFEGPIYNWNNHGYDKWFGIPKDKDYDKARKNFLYFSSGGQVLTGLHLVLDAFSRRPNLNLFVCGPYEHEREFVECYQKEIYQTNNIVPVGWVTVGSPKYFELMKQCCATIFPICGGASPGAVVVCMQQGLIPIISQEAGISTKEFGITLSSNTVDEIGRAVDWLSEQTEHWHKEIAQKVLEEYNRNYSQTTFTQRFKEILNCEILRRKLI